MVAGFIPFDAGRSAPRELPERVFVDDPKQNLKPIERNTTLVLGLALFLDGLRRGGKSWSSRAAIVGGGVLALRAIGGYCPIEARLLEHEEELHDNRVRQFLPRILRSISIRASREEIVARLADLPNVDGVRFEVKDGSTSDEILWSCQKLSPYGSFGKDPEPPFEGVIRLIDGPPKKGIELQASIDNVPADISGEEMEAILRRVLRSLKQFVEAGEIATTAGQSHGRRRRFSFKGTFSRLIHKLMNEEELRHVGAVLERS